MPGQLYFTVGLPRSGKSTLADRWVGHATRFSGDHLSLQSFLAREWPEHESVWLDGSRRWWGDVKRPRAVVAGDDFRTALHGQPYVYESECVVFAAMDLATRALLLRGFDVIVDETCTTEQTLYRYLKIDLDARPVFVDTPAEVCLERARASGRGYLDGPIRAMAAQLASLRADWDGTYARVRQQIIRRYPTQYQQERHEGPTQSGS